MPASFPKLHLFLLQRVPKLRFRHAVILAELLDVAKGGEFAMPSVNTMASWFGRSRSLMSKVRAELATLGYLKLNERRQRGSGANTSNACHFSETLLQIYRQWRALMMKAVGDARCRAQRGQGGQSVHAVETQRGKGDSESITNTESLAARARENFVCRGGVSLFPGRPHDPERARRGKLRQLGRYMREGRRWVASAEADMRVLEILEAETQDATGDSFRAVWQQGRRWFNRLCDEMHQSHWWLSRRAGMAA